MIIEYAGLADRWVGPGVVHNVRAWWNVIHDSETEVKRAALDAVRPEISSTDHMSVDPIEADTYSTPQLNALVRVRVITHEQHVERDRLRSVIVHACADCADPSPCNYLRMPDDTEKAVCYTCLRKQSGEYCTIAWIRAGGKLQV